MKDLGVDGRILLEWILRKLIIPRVSGTTITHNTQINTNHTINTQHSKQYTKHKITNTTKPIHYTH